MIDGPISRKRARSTTFTALGWGVGARGSSGPALWTRDHDGHPAGSGLVHHSRAGSQHTSTSSTDHLSAAGVDASIGSVGDATVYYGEHRSTLTGAIN